MTAFLSRRDLAFQLNEVQSLGAVLGFGHYAEHDAQSCEAMIDAAVKLAADKFWPHAAKADAEEPTFDGQSVKQPPEVKAAVQAYIEAGFLGAAFDAEDGGLQLPWLVTTAINFAFCAAAIGTAGYSFLTAAAASLLRAHGSEAQRARWLPRMLAGECFGTMCLSEPQAGSSLGDIKTRAISQADGRYRIVGNKMWISGGEQGISDNIVHLVLARIEGAPAGVKGISLFLVPKRHLAEDGSPGALNGVRLIGLNHKMGYRATTNCALAFGDGEDCIGELVGTPGQGLACMFHMMNEARIGVGMGAVAIGTAGYHVALDYCRSRPQGRALGNKNPDAAQVNIIEHADVRRMLLAQKAYVEGGISLGFHCARLVDEQRAHPDPEARKAAAQLLDFITPIVKSWPSDWCLKANELAIQCLGGYGYTRDYPVERLYRDNRLNPIHEGTNGIQSLDLLGRKVFGDGGKGLRAYSALLLQTAEAAAGDAELAGYAKALKAAVARIASTTAVLGGEAAQGRVEKALANSHAYLELLGHTTIAWVWLKQALVARAAAPTASATDAGFYAGKLAACRYFFVHELPKTEAWAALLQSLDTTVLDIQKEQF